MWAGASSSNVVNAAAALIVAALVIAALTLARDFLLPLALAALLSFALQPAVRWLEEQRPGLGGEFFDEIEVATKQLHEYPEIGSPVSRDRLTRRLLVQRFPYQVVYRLTTTEIVIVAVAHLKRRPGYWRGRH